MFLLDFILHIDQHLAVFINQYGLWVYALLFLIIFVETGFVFMPFLPGDNLLFAAGALSGFSSLNPWLVGILLITAAILGDSCNYLCGRHFGLRLFNPNRRFPPMRYLTETEAFFHKHGGKSVFLGRFFPIIRTFTPFVAGLSRMPYWRFFAYSSSGSVVWVSSLVTAGYFLGRLQFVRDNLTAIIVLIIALSMAPIFIKAVMSFRTRKSVM